jgi:hypothetical protein
MKSTVKSESQRINVAVENTDQKVKYLFGFLLKHAGITSSIFIYNLSSG